MLVGKYTVALDELLGTEDLLIECVHFSIIMNEIGVLKTRHEFFQLT